MAPALADRLSELVVVDPDGDTLELLWGSPGLLLIADAMLERTGREIGVVLFFDVPEAELKKRIAHRSEVDHRADDTPAAYVQRRREYEEKTAPVLGYYEGRGTRIEFVNGNLPIEAVTDSILTIFGDQVRPGEVA